MIHDTQSAHISQKQDGRNIYMKQTGRAHCFHDYIYLSIYLSTYLSIYLSIYLYLSIYIYIYIYIYKEEQLEVFVVLLSLFCDAFQLSKDKDI